MNLRSLRARASLLVAAAALAVAVLASSAGAAPIGHAPAFQPIDPQNWVMPDQQTWADYHPVPNTDWGNPALQPTVEKWRTALVFVDYPDQPPVISLPARSTVFGNPQLASDVPRDQVAQFYADFLNKPQPLNNWVTMNKYWMEDSLGRYGVDVVPFGVYRLPGNTFEYNLRDAGNAPGACPTGFGTCSRNFRNDALALWRAAEGATINTQFDNVFYVSAGQDESGTWQEFGEMMFQDRDAVTDAFGNPDETKPNWAPTRYVPWTSFASARTIWPSASGTSSTEAESSGMGVFAHELSHNLSIGDNYNNPYGIPLRRSYTGPWDMMSRGSFNGPGGPHTRWHIPATQGGSLGSNHNLRNKLRLGFVTEDDVLRLNRNELDNSGLVVAKVKARAADAGGLLTGVNVALTADPSLPDPTRGDQSPTCVVAENPDCPGPTRTSSGAISASSLYNNYTVEVVQQLGNDSFTPGNGVLISRTKNADSAPFVWIIDAHPEDFNKIDFFRPNGEPAMISYGDYRQLGDATFNAGLASGTKYEYVDGPNRLHFYVIDVERDADGIRTYTVAVRSLDGAGQQARGVGVRSATTSRVRAAWAANCNFPVTNTGAAGPVAGAHPEDVSSYADGDVYRLTSTLQGEGWSAQLYNALATADAGQTTNVPVYVTRTPGASNRAVVTLTATSESDPTKKSTATCSLKVSDLNR
jgi:M6 family metalloprotease-like protein